MKNTTQICILFLVIPILSGFRCTKDERGRTLLFHNTANHPIQVYLNNDQQHTAVYPDTSITDFEERVNPSMIISVGERKGITEGGATWKNIFEVSVPSDTLSLIIFHPDTLAAYPWQVVRNQYKVLRRYDLSLDDLNRLDFIVPYPPTAEMAGMKMWPR